MYAIPFVVCLLAIGATNGHGLDLGDMEGEAHKGGRRTVEGSQAPVVNGEGGRMPVPEMYWGDTSRRGRPFSKDPSVVRFGGRYLLYFSLPPYEDDRLNNGWAVGIAESKDLLDWRKAGEVLPAQKCDRRGLAAPCAIVLDDTVHLFYQTYGNGPRDAICHATSEDGITFFRNPDNPIFRPSGDWTVGRAIDADAFVHDGRLLLYWATRDPEMRVQMVGVAAAPLDSDFGRDTWTQLCDGPILAPEQPWEQDCIEASSVFRHGDRLYMFYAGAYNNRPQQIGCAMSMDGIHWKRLSDTPFLANGPPGSWNASESGHPGVFVDDDGRTYLFYQGNNDEGRTWYLSRVEVVWDGGKPRLAAP